MSRNQTLNTTIIRLGEHIDGSLYENLYLLSLKFPMNKQLKAQMKKDILRIPNSSAFFQVAYYLMSVIDKSYVTPELEYLFFDPKMAVKSRKEFLNFVMDVDKKYSGYLSQIVPSWLVTAGGPKVTKLMLELTQIALHIQISKCKKQKEELCNIRTKDADFIQNETSKIQMKTREIICEDIICMQNIEKIAEIYKTEISKVQSDIDMHNKVLNDLIDTLCRENDADQTKIKQLSDTSLCPLLEDWEKYIERQTKKFQLNWEKSSMDIIITLKELKLTCEEIIQLYMKKQNNTLEYDPSQTKIFSKLLKHPEVPEDLKDIVENVVRDDKFHLPQLFKAYKTVLNHYFKVIRLFNVNEKYCLNLNEKQQQLIKILNQVDQTNMLINLLQEQLKETKITEAPSEGMKNNWISNTVNIPLIRDLLNPL